MLCNPNNPTGTALDHAALVSLLERVPRRVSIIVDEVYADFASDVSVVDQVCRFPNLCVVRSFSKGYALAGLRVRLTRSLAMSSRRLGTAKGICCASASSPTSRQRRPLRARITTKGRSDYFWPSVTSCEAVWNGRWVVLHGHLELTSSCCSHPEMDPSIGGFIAWPIPPFSSRQLDGRVLSRATDPSSELRRGRQRRTNES